MTKANNKKSNFSRSLTNFQRKILIFMEMSNSRTLQGVHGPLQTLNKVRHVDLTFNRNAYTIGGGAHLKCRGLGGGEGKRQLLQLLLSTE